MKRMLASLSLLVALSGGCASMDNGQPYSHANVDRWIGTPPQVRAKCVVQIKDDPRHLTLEQCIKMREEVRAELHDMVTFPWKRPWSGGGGGGQGTVFIYSVN